MNRLTIIGNVTKAPELRTTQDGISICTFDVAVNRRKKSDGTQDVDYFHVNAWRSLGETCAKYLTKGSKTAVVGPVSVSTYQGNDGKTYANLEVIAQDVEFLSPAGQDSYGEQRGKAEAPKIDQESGFAAVETDELPF